MARKWSKLKSVQVPCRLLIAGLLTLSLTSPGGGQNQHRFIPPPLKIHVPFDVAWETMLATLEEKDLKVNHQERGRGVMVTEFLEYISGPLTESHIEKIGEKPRLIESEWVRVRYQYEILIELLGERDTWVTVYANIEALKREFLGKETWLNIQTNGNLEERLLTDFGRNLFGQSFSLEKPRKGIWERDPTYVPDLDGRIPKMVGPERRP